MRVCLLIAVLALALACAHAVRVTRYSPSGHIIAPGAGDGRGIVSVLDTYDSSWITMIQLGRPATPEELAALHADLFNGKGEESPCHISATVTSNDLLIIEIACTGYTDDDEEFPPIIAVWTARYAADIVITERNRRIEHHLFDFESVPGMQNGATWGLDRIDQPFGLPDNRYYYPGDGDGVDLYVIDTGLRATHTDYGGRATMDFNAVGDGKDYDCNGHGTHVASIAGGTRYGAAKSVTIHGIKALDCHGRGSTLGILAAIAHISDEHNSTRPGVVNMSFGGSVSITIDAAATNLVTHHNFAVSVAAGNAGESACGSSPARAPVVLTISASDSSDRLAYFSNFGSCVDFSAPGVSITAAGHHSDTNLATHTGTSMAAPFASGVLAIVRGMDTSLSGEEAMAMVKLWASRGVIQTIDEESLFTSAGTGDLLYSRIDPSKPLDQFDPLPSSAAPRLVAPLSICAIGVMVVAAVVIGAR